MRSLVPFTRDLYSDPPNAKPESFRAMVETAKTYELRRRFAG